MSNPTESLPEMISASAADRSILYGFRRRLAVGGAILAGMVGASAFINASPAQADGSPQATTVQDIDIVNKAHIPKVQIDAFEKAAIVQSEELNAVWNTPVIQFKPDGWRVVLVSANKHHPIISNQISYHSFTANTHRPYVRLAAGLYLAKSKRPLPWTVELSHELSEALGDPLGDESLGKYKKEIADPVRKLHYYIGNVLMDDFVTPAWFIGGPGPYDEMHTLTRPGSVKYGFATTVDGRHLGLPAVPRVYEPTKHLR